MKFCITTNKNIKAFEEALHLKEKLQNDGDIYDDKNPEIVFSIGGDGNLLKTVQRYLDVDPIFASVNFGNLGYLCEYKGNEIDKLIDDIKKDMINYKEISFLEANVNNEKLYALNEFKVISNNGKTLKFDVLINNTLLENFKGDGCVVTSSIGSSGLGKSLGGALVDNEIEMIQFVEIAPIKNRLVSSIGSPYVLNKDKVITLKGFKPNKFSLFYDCKSLNIDDYDGEISFKVSEKKIKFLKNYRNNYIEKTREAFVSD
ncbi:MAG: NAD(+)/NADH kinase [Bacilli bacterium]|nr:NAD(+)/NADH kinase [Bacilli bacterium]